MAEQKEIVEWFRIVSATSFHAYELLELLETKRNSLIHLQFVWVHWNSCLYISCVVGILYGVLVYFTCWERSVWTWDLGIGFIGALHSYTSLNSCLACSSKFRAVLRRGEGGGQSSVSSYWLCEAITLIQAPFHNFDTLSARFKGH